MDMKNDSGSPHALATNPVHHWYDRYANILHYVLISLYLSTMEVPAT